METEDIENSKACIAKQRHNMSSIILIIMPTSNIHKYDLLWKEKNVI